jgi:hypothetical protein
MRHTSDRSPGSYLARPRPQVIRALAVVGGMGILTTTPVAFLSMLKSALILRFTKSLVFPSSVIVGIRRKGCAAAFVTRYRMSSNSPSGGMKVIVRSVSNFPSRTHLEVLGRKMSWTKKSW